MGAIDGLEEVASTDDDTSFLVAGRKSKRLDMGLIAEVPNQ